MSFRDLRLEQFELGVRVTDREQRESALCIALIGQFENLLLQVALSLDKLEPPLRFSQAHIRPRDFGGELDFRILGVRHRGRSLSVNGLDTPCLPPSEIDLPVCIEPDVVDAEAVLLFGVCRSAGRSRGRAAADI